MSAMRCVNYLPYHKVHLWRRVINMHRYECFQNWTSPLPYFSLPPSLFSFFLLLRANNIKTTFFKCNPPVDVLETFSIPSPLLLCLCLSSSLLLNLLIALQCGTIWKMFWSHKVIRKSTNLYDCSYNGGTRINLPLPRSSWLIFIIKILFLISMDFLPRAGTAVTPLTRTYNVLNIQINIFFSLSSFLQHVKLFLQSSTKPTPPSLPSIMVWPPQTTSSRADALNAPTTHSASLTSPCSCLFAIRKWKTAIKVALYAEGS